MIKEYISDSESEKRDSKENQVKKEDMQDEDNHYTNKANLSQTFSALQKQVKGTSKPCDTLKWQEVIQELINDYKEVKLFFNCYLSIISISHKKIYFLNLLTNLN